MPILTEPLPLTLALVVGMLLATALGHRGGLRRRAVDRQATHGVGAMNAAVFALLGLMVAFTFSGAASRFDVRRALVTEECNDIGTAWLRLDLLPAEAQARLRERLRQYLDSRLQTYRVLPDVDAAMAELRHTDALQQGIWAVAVAACEAKGDAATKTLVLGALNTMFDITGTRTAAALHHTPPLIFALLFLLALGCALLAGHGMAGAAKVDWLHCLVFTAMMAPCVYVILDLEYPRSGVFRLDAYDQQLVDLRAKMG
ncbi:MAG TPA: DUF4239 domain-containing protein [Planctomycetota bacterium]|nr:DUF4239 domain-containing protein [Planctomycetota bacterium]